MDKIITCRCILLGPRYGWRTWLTPTEWVARWTQFILGHTQSLKPWTKGATACRGLTEQHWRNSIMEFCWKRSWIQSHLQRSQLYLPSNAIRQGLHWDGRRSANRQTYVGCQQAIEEGISWLARSAVNLTVWDWWIFSNIFGAKCWLCAGRWVIYNHVSQCVVILCPI